MVVTLKDIKSLVKDLQEFMNNSKDGDTRVFIDSLSLETINGIGEDLYMTNYRNIGVFVHYGVEGDWTKAVLIPVDNFPNETVGENDLSSADEALEWFFDLLL